MSDLLYDALMLGRNKKTAQEEFLLATGQKAPVAFTVTEERIKLSNVISDGEFFVRLSQLSPGYSEIHISCEASFIFFEKRVVSSDDFKDGSLRLRFYTVAGFLHNGLNMTEIHFTTADQDLVVRVEINNRIKIRLSDKNPGSKLVMLQEAYLKLKMGLLEHKKWVDESLKLLDENISEDVFGLYLMLYKAQIYLSAQDPYHAKNLIEHVGRQIPKLEKKSYLLYCYFIYLASLYDDYDGAVNFMLSTDEDKSGLKEQAAKTKGVRTDRVQDMTAPEKLHWVYRQAPSWKIFWLLCNMDPSIRLDLKLQYSEYRRFFDKGRCTSPVVYLRCLQIINQNPEYMTEIGQFELQIMNFARKREIIDKRVLDRAVELFLLKDYKEYSPDEISMAVMIFTAVYDQYPDMSLLRSICVLLIEAGNKSEKYHVYFEKAIEKGIHDEAIKDYFIYTLNRSEKKPLPQLIYRHFLDHTELFYDFKAYIYSLIVLHKYNDEQLYREFKDQIIRFAEYQSLVGQLDEELAVLYKDILNQRLLTDGLKDSIFEIVCSRQICCENVRMEAVLVFHRELLLYQESLLKNGKAFVKIYSADAIILFRDFYGNLYHNIDYKVNTFIDIHEYADLLMSDAGICYTMLLRDQLPLLRAYKSPEEVLGFLADGGFLGQFRKSYEAELLDNMISYYVKNFNEEPIYDLLLRLLRYDLPEQARGRLIGIMVKQGLYEEAYRQIGKYGTCKMDGASIAMAAHAYIKENGYEPKELLTRLCEIGYRAVGFDDEIFEYLYQNYDGDMDLLIDIYRTGNAYQRPSSQLEVRILKKAILTGEHPQVVNTVFKRHYEKGEDPELLIKYMEYRAQLYLSEIMTGSYGHANTLDMEFFDIMEKEMFLGTEFSDVSQIAYLLQRRGLAVPSQRQLHNIEMCLRDLVRRGKMLEEFKYFKKYFELPSTLANNIIVSAFSEESIRPKIIYEISGPSGRFRAIEAMEEIFPHCFVKYVTLFYGEKVVFTMDGQKSSEIKYSELDIQRDGSSYAMLDKIYEHKANKDTQGLKASMQEYYLQRQLIERLF